MEFSVKRRLCFMSLLDICFSDIWPVLVQNILFSLHEKMPSSFDGTYATMIRWILYRIVTTNAWDIVTSCKYIAYLLYTYLVFNKCTWSHFHISRTYSPLIIRIFIGGAFCSSNASRRPTGALWTANTNKIHRAEVNLLKNHFCITAVSFLHHVWIYNSPFFAERNCFLLLVFKCLLFRMTNFISLSKGQVWYFNRWNYPIQYFYIFESFLFDFILKK